MQTNNQFTLSRVVSGPKVRHVLEHEIAIEKGILEVNSILGNNDACQSSKHKIADAKIYLLRLSGDLPL
jgi:hypothetical protein